MEKLIEVENLSFSYHHTPIFSDVNLSIRRGDFVAIIGSNGTGKSTLMRLMLGEMEPTEGRIALFGQDLHKFRDWPKIGYVPQNGLAAKADFPATAEEIVGANLFSQVGLFRFMGKKHREQVRSALEKVDMLDYAKRMIGNMSGGQQQRIMLAKSLINQPQIMLMDEPTTGVDSKTVESLYRFLTKLNKESNMTIVMITHDVSRAMEYVHRVFCLEEGSMVELNKAQLRDELAHRHKHSAASVGRR